MTTLEFNYKIAGLRASLHEFTRRFTSDREESHDLVQETILKALMYREKFTADTNLKGWLFTIMRNIFINNYRRRQRARTIHDTTKELYFLNVEDPHTFHSPVANIEYEDVWHHVNALREELLAPFKLHTSGYKYHEIADILQIPLGTVKNRIFTARKEIQRKLNGYQ